MNSHASPITITLVGRTGAGKSTLANWIAQAELFPVGYGLDSKTDTVKATITKWPIAPFTDVQIIDSPGFGDNRPDMTNAILLTRIVDFLNSLQGGLHIALFCIPAKQRLDAHDVQELELLGLLLGETLFKHVYIVVTQVNTLIQDERQKVYTNFTNGLFKIYESHGLPPFSPDKLIFADLDDFEEKLLIPLGRVLPTATSYKPKLAQGIDLDDPDSIQKFLTNKELKPILDKFETMLQAERKKNEDMRKILETRLAENRRLIEQNAEEKKASEQRLNSIQVSLNQQIAQNQSLKANHEEQKRQQAQQLQALQSQLTTLSQQKSYYETQLQNKQTQIDNMNQRINQIQAAPRYQPPPQRGKSRGRCNMF